METILLSGAALVLSGLIQWLKNKWPTINPLVIGFAIALIGGIAYAVLLRYNLWIAFKNFTMVVFTGAIAIYAIFLEIMKKVGADTSLLAQPTPPPPPAA